MGSEQGTNKGEMPAGEVVRLADLVNYQDGSVVSRTIVKRASGTVTLFAFDQGQCLSEHTAAFDVVANILEGEADSQSQARCCGRRQERRFSSLQTNLTL